MISNNFSKNFSNAGNNMNMIMFTPSPGRRSLFNRKRRSNVATCDPGDLKQLEYAKVVYEGIRFFVKSQNNPNFDPVKYFKSLTTTFADDQIALTLLKHIIFGSLKLRDN